ncbi:hypothetical protein LR48_Vigan05g092000 [Vigna angularis]|uniref:Uncharacterized protein n=1 Tax=Phaseolus angularis TaxID=3914 RepID=A0A0L9UKU6_PHAAN|nr:hypothetical protein LR48_Vigan05g092000 [Vigna angularis]
MGWACPNPNFIFSTCLLLRLHRSKDTTSTHGCTSLTSQVLRRRRSHHSPRNSSHRRSFQRLHLLLHPSYSETQIGNEHTPSPRTPPCNLEVAAAIATSPSSVFRHSQEFSRTSTVLIPLLKLAGGAMLTIRDRHGSFRRVAFHSHSRFLLSFPPTICTLIGLTRHQCP